VYLSFCGGQLLFVFKNSVFWAKAQVKKALSPLVFGHSRLAAAVFV
jgi:hypothetical protein